jgi:hypothetical protein
VLSLHWAVAVPQEADIGPVQEFGLGGSGTGRGGETLMVPEVVVACELSSLKLTVTVTCVATGSAESWSKTMGFESRTPPAEILDVPSIGSSTVAVAVGPVPKCNRNSALVTVAPTCPLNSCSLKWVG